MMYTVDFLFSVFPLLLSLLSFVSAPDVWQEDPGEDNAGDVLMFILHVSFSSFHWLINVFRLCLLFILIVKLSEIINLK